MGKKGEKQHIKKTEKTKFIDSWKFMSTSPTNLTNNPSEKRYQRRRINCKYFPQDQKFKGDLFIRNC